MHTVNGEDIMASDAKHARSWELLARVICEFKNNAISRRLLFFLIWLMKEKNFLHVHVIEVRDEPARPGRNAILTGYF